MMSVAAVPLNSHQGGSAKSRVTYYGIEVDQELTWRKWEPGQRYTKRLILKNVNYSTQRLDFRVPHKDVFSTVYPKTITLSAGTSFNLPVTFRPDTKEVYEDDIEFRTSTGEQFRIPVKALLPQYAVQLPETVDLGLCAVHGERSAEFTLRNASELETEFRWAAEAPFSLDPVQGVLPPHGTRAIRVQFLPKEPGAFSLAAVVQFGSGLRLSERTRLTAVAKYPQVRVSLPGRPLSALRLPSGALRVDFGSAELGRTKERLLSVENTSAVDAVVRLRRSDAIHPQDRCFDCPVAEAAVPARTALHLQMHFRPRVPHFRSVENWRVDVGQCGGISLQCTGLAVGPSVALSCSLINFHRLEEGQTARQPLEITNRSDSAQPFQFQCDPLASVFALDCCDGVLKPQESRRIVVTFRPQFPIQYYRRLTCLVPDHEPLFLQLLGTCHGDKLRPHVLRPVHLKQFEARRQRGLSFCPPEELDAMLSRGKLQVDADGAVMMKEAEELEAFCDPPTALAPMQQYFYEEHDSDWAFSLPHLSLDRACVDFEDRGCVLFEPRSPEDATPTVEEPLAVKNNTRGTVLVHWMGLERAAVFRVEPVSLEIPAGKTATCRVLFTPTNEHAIYGAELEAFASFKTQREFQIADEATISPPWCLTVRCLGHTFPSKAEPFLPQFEFSRADLTFPSAARGEAVFRTVGLANCGDTPILYRAQESDSSFAVKPAQAVVAPGHQQLITVRCLPPGEGAVSGLLRLRMNERADVDAALPLLCSADGPAVMLDDKGELYFVPTNVGNSSCRQFAFKNVSRVPVEFQWKIRHNESGSISVDPVAGLVNPNEVVAQTWRFSPQAVGLRVFKPRLAIRGRTLTGAASEQRSVSLRVIGEGVEGSVRAGKEYEDFGSLVVGSSATRPLELINESACAVRIRLSVEQRIDGPAGLCLDLGREPPSLELSETELVLPGRCRRSIRVTARPQRRVYYQHAISYHLLPDRTDDEEDVRDVAALQPEGQHLCHVLVTGVFPVLQVTDVQASGSARGLSKRQAWTYLSMDDFNVCLDADPAAAELAFSVATRQSYQRSPPVYTRAVLDFNFGAAPVGAEEAVFSLLLDNPGLVATEFAFLFPEELHVELEYWTETGEFSEQELHEMRVQEQRLFDVRPRRGRLAPGESRVVEMRHSHHVAGTARLPVLMKIDKGREILLNFVGVTVAPDRVYLHYPSARHDFAPVPIGEAEPPVQTFELYNGGALPVHFEVDTTPLALLRRENHDMPIFECLTPTGQVLPGRTAHLLWRFRPVEPRNYSVEVPVRAHNGECALLTVAGAGFDPRRLGDAAPAAGARVPGLQQVPLPGQAAFLSEERLALGAVPRHSRTRRVVFLNNRSLENAMSFTWHVTASGDADVVHVSPARGHLAPGQSLLCHVTFTASGPPRFFDLDLICEVTDETRLQQYEEELAAWDKELVRQQEEFTITEKRPQDDQRVWRAQKEGRSAALVEAPADINQYKLFALDPRVHICTPFEPPPRKALPPIHERPTASVARSGRDQRRFEEDFWRRPTPPRPFVLHLGVTARSHDVAEFRQNFPDRWPLVTMDRLLMLQDAARPDPGPAEGFTVRSEHCSDAEHTVVEATLSNILNSLIHDTDFLSAVEAIPGEEIPYFCQYGADRPRVPPATPATGPQVASEPQASVTSPLPSSGLPSPLRALPESPCTPPAADAAVVAQQEEEEGERAPSVPSQRSAGSLEDEREAVARCVPFETIVGSLLENMVTNIMAEANSSEYDITARPRLIALPPRNRSANTRRSRVGTPR